MRDTHLVSQPPAWSEWIIANAIGYALGVALWQAAFPAIRPVLAPPLDGILLIAGLGASVGLFAGLAQALILRLERAWASAWVLATILGAAVGFVIAAEISGMVSEALAPRIGAIPTDVVLFLICGAIFGAGMGLAQWLIFHAHEVSLLRWVLASTLGLMVGYTLATGVALSALALLPPVDQPWIGAAFGVCAGATTALIEWLIVGRQLAWRRQVK